MPSIGYSENNQAQSTVLLAQNGLTIDPVTGAVELYGTFTKDNVEILNGFCYSFLGSNDSIIIDDETKLGIRRATKPQTMLHALESNTTGTVDETSSVLGILNPTANIGALNLMGGNNIASPGSKSIVWGEGLTNSGVNNLVVGEDNNVQGSNNLVAGIDNSTNFTGISNLVVGNQAGIITGNSGGVLGTQSMYEGNNSLVGGFQSSIGVSGDTSIAWGNNAMANGLTGFALGTNVNTVGTDSLLMGKNSTTTANGSASAGFGSELVIDSNEAFVQGNNHNVTGKNQVVFGQFSNSYGVPANFANTDYVFIIGNGDSNANRSEAIKIRWDGVIELGNAFRNPATDPAPVAGGLYYNSTLQKFRVCEDGATWVNMV